jgi:hypothetical protein
MYFEDISPSDVPSLQEVLNDYIDRTPVNKTMNKERNQEELLFAQVVNDTLYRGYIRVMYWDWSRKRPHPFPNCLYITHMMITPRGGNLLDTALKQVIHNPKVDTIYIESIMSDDLLAKFQDKGWTVDGYSNNVYLKKPEASSSHDDVDYSSVKRSKVYGGKGKKKTYKKRKSCRRRKKSCKRRYTH